MGMRPQGPPSDKFVLAWWWKIIGILLAVLAGVALYKNVYVIDSLAALGGWGILSVLALRFARS